MADDRRSRIIARLAGDDGGLETKRLCQVSADVIDVAGAGIMLMTGDAPRGSVCTTDDVSALIEQLQYELGEGPCVDAYNLDHPVLEPDLADPEAPRWLAFTPPAVAAGVRAVFGFPLQVGGVRLGALNLYRDSPGALDDDQHANALVMADVVAQAVLLIQAKASPGEVSAELESGADFQYVVHQASGMVAVQLGVSVAQALVCLRARAFASGRPLADVARYVVARSIRFVQVGEDDQGS